MFFRDLLERIPLRLWIIALLLAGAITVGLVIAVESGRRATGQPMPITGRWDEQARITIVPLSSPTPASAGGSGEPISGAAGSGTGDPAAAPSGLVTTPQAGSFVSATCTYAETYWLEHPEVWPTENIIIGSHTYNKREMLDALAVQDASPADSLLKQLLVTLLNATRGADTRQVDTAIEDGAIWLGRNLNKAFLSESENQQASQLATTLQAYNLGQLGLSPCPGQKLILAFPSVSSPTPGIEQSPTPPAGSSPGIRRSTLTPTRTREERDPSQPEPKATSTPRPTQTMAASRTPPPGLPSSTSVSPTLMPGLTATPLLPTFAIPTVTPPASPSDTPRPTATREPTQTSRPPATSTPEPTDRPTQTSRPPATSTPKPTDRPTRTRQPSHTPRPTNTPRPTATATQPQPTATSAPTATPVPPTATPIPPDTNTPLPPAPTSAPPPTNTSQNPTDTPPPPQPTDTQQPLITLVFTPLPTLSISPPTILPPAGTPNPTQTVP